MEWMVSGDYRELRLVAKKNGQELSDSYVNPGQKAMLSVTDVAPRGDHASVRILNVCITDANGVPLLSENGMLYIGGEVLGVGNGDPNGHHDDKEAMAEGISPPTSAGVTDTSTAALEFFPSRAW